MDTKNDPLWYKNAIIYQVHVKGFKDLDGDGTGDFAGLTSKLDYLEGLGITAIWLLPFYPSPLKDDGYDISNYLGVNPKYGTLRDFRRFLEQAHRRGLRVVTELVINHTSDQHPWFQRARHAKEGSPWRNYYVWSDTPERYSDARIIFKDFETSNWTWDPVAKAYFWHRFYSHQPSLNFDNPHIHKEIFKIIDFWLRMGVDGLRLDAVPYLFQREGTNCENLPETHAFLKELRRYVDTHFPNRMLLAEANQWPEDAVAYFGDSDECHMAFHFPIMPRLYMALQMEDRFPIVDILEQTPSIPATCQWAMFLRNHDELTLEMVSDEERDYMYHMFAKDHSARINLGIRRRLAPLLENDRRKIQLLNILLMSFPGTPIIYYGDEIGMGDNYYLGDRNGIRTPMQWATDRNGGFSSANPQQLYLPLIIDPQYHYEVVNVENEDRNSASLLWWTRRLLFERQKYPAFGLGSFETLLPDNPRVLAFIRSYEDHVILVIVNFSRFPQAALFDLSKYSGCRPVELSHHNEFPLIHDTPYTITLGPFGYFLLSLKHSESLKPKHEATPHLKVSGSWDAVFKNQTRHLLENELLPQFLLSRHWFERRCPTIQKVTITHVIPMGKAFLLILEVLFMEEQWTETYLLPLAFKTVATVESLGTEAQKAIIATLQINGTKGYLFEAIYDPSFCQQLALFIKHQRRYIFTGGQLLGQGSKHLPIHKTAPPIHVLEGEHSHSVLQYDQTLLLKLYRHLEDGLNPDIDMNEFLNKRESQPQETSYHGQLLWKKDDTTTVAICLVKGFVANHTNGWDYTWDALSRYYEHILSHREELERELKSSDNEETFIEKLIGSYLAIAALIGEKTAKMHIALASDTETPAFKPEPFGQLYLRSTYQGLRISVRRILLRLKRQENSFPPHFQDLIKDILTHEPLILGIFKKILTCQMDGWRIRIHGDYRLQEILLAGKELYIIDFEGEKGLPLNVRRSKRSPILDIAAMLYSLRRIASSHLFSEQMIKPEVAPSLAIWSHLWYRGVSRAFLRTYEDTIMATAPTLLPHSIEQRETLLHAWTIKQAFYHIDEEMRNSPENLISSLTTTQELLRQLADNENLKSFLL